DVPGRRGRDPPQPAFADGRAGAVHAAAGAADAPDRRAGTAHCARRLRARAVLLLCRTDVPHRTRERHGRRPDVDPPWLGRAWVRLDPASRGPASRRRRARGRKGAGGARRAPGVGMTFALFVVPIMLLLIGFPIFMVLLTAVAVALVFFMHVPLVVVHQNLFGSVNATPLLAVPFFIYAGELMGRGSVAQRLVDFVQAGVGSVRGSLGVTAVGTSAIFGAISGASAATVATIGKVMVPAMRRAGYPETFAAGLITAVGAIDVIIPPSIPMIVYGAAAEESVARLYAAGVFPGLLIAI